MSLSHAPRINTSAVICTCNLDCRERNFARIIGSLMNAFRRIFCICCSLLLLLLLLCSVMGVIGVMGLILPLSFSPAKYGIHNRRVALQQRLTCQIPKTCLFVYSSAADSVYFARLRDWHWYAACRHTQLGRYSTGREKQKHGQGANPQNFRVSGLLGFLGNGWNG